MSRPLAIAILLFGAAACAPVGPVGPSDGEDDFRVDPQAKFDSNGNGTIDGSCMGADGPICDDIAPGGECYCTPECVMYGSCCDDYVASCGTLQYNSYDVLFTNPVCPARDLDHDVDTVSGDETRTQTRENVFCTYDDIGTSAARESSPNYRIREWVGELGEGDEIFMAYLSFSNSAGVNALCEAAARGAKVTIAMDSGQDRTKLDDLTSNPNCRPAGADENPVTALYLGNDIDVGYQHNKVIIINPHGDSEFMRVAFSSGNFSSGTVTHHENWHFVEAKRDGYFAQSHVCLQQALTDGQGKAPAGWTEPLDYDGDGVKAADTRAEFTEFMTACQEAIPFPMETDIRPFFIPNINDSRRLKAMFGRGLNLATSVDVAVHRFSLWYVKSALTSRLQNERDFSVRMVADDDIFWLRPWSMSATGQLIPGAANSGSKLGDNTDSEAGTIASLWNATQGPGQEQPYGDVNQPGTFEIRFMETNSGQHQLHHNKIIIMHDLGGLGTDAVVCGAANFTNDAYDVRDLVPGTTSYGGRKYNNFENVYFITIPEVTAAMSSQFNRFWGEEGMPDGSAPPMATPIASMPVEFVGGH